MSVTEKLLRVFRVDQQLTGLQSRLRGAEKFLGEQTKQLGALDSKRESLNTQLRQLQATIADHEGEMARLDSRVEQLREQMNNAKTNKEYKAFLTEVNTLKADRSTNETAALELMTKADALKAQLGEIDAQRGERQKVTKVADEDRGKRADEIRDKLKELIAERETLVNEVPADVLKAYTDLVARLGEDAMAPLNELDRRRHEYTCGNCQMALPVESVNSLLKGNAGTHGVTRCVSCGCILYIEKETVESLQPQPKTKKGKKEKAAEQL
jgi:predicted  nucleic acid-binding Zn-ribbon protein